MQHNFSAIPAVNIPRSMFRRPHNLKTTIGTDYLYPIYVDEALPGDTFKFSANLFGRLSTPIVPLMDNLYLDVFFFAVPIRLIDDNFRRVMGEKPFGDTTTDYTIPRLLVSPSTGTLSDYLGLPAPLEGDSYYVCPYWHRAYNLVYNEWFRDENLCSPRAVAGVEYDGTVHEERESDYVLLKRCKRHDYFTSALPWPQKGTAASINLAGGRYPVRGDGRAIGLVGLSAEGNSELGYLIGNGGNSSNGYAGVLGVAGGLNSSSPHPNWPFAGDHTLPNDASLIDGAPTATSTSNVRAIGLSSADSHMYADVSSQTIVTINAFREALAVQSLLELDARGGTRLIEIIRAHFGVVSPDARMQRPEYLGGASQIMTITSVPTTSDSASAPSHNSVGSLGAFGTVGTHCDWIKSFTEHCVIIGLANVRADLSYQQGVPRMFLRRTRYDFYWPALANLGEQGIYNMELCVNGFDTSASSTNKNQYGDYDIFGYQERWAEYRYHPNMITGKFRSGIPGGSLDYWHLAQEFDSTPTLSRDFIEEDVPIKRVVAVTDEPPLILDAYFDVNCARPMPLYSVPSLGNRF